ncbi:MAG TPA: Na+/H+ antiporter NhaA [Sphingomicrobium sp.]|nr:Na+/H+ antiporter NhaA [Sphingomicrobium sp.]
MAGGSSDVQKQEKLAGLLLIAAAAIALILANSSLADVYHAVLETKVGPAMPRFGILSVHHWIADGLMAAFFLLVGLEVKREWYAGRLSSPAERRLPIVAAAAGMAVPALIYLAFTGFDPALSRGWAIPSATDIAFAVGVLALLGSRANPAIKLLLVTIAIVDDVGAVIIIALVYTTDLSAAAIGAATVLLGCMAALNMFGVRRLWPYLIGFGLLWYAILASGVHATIAGVLAAFVIPLGKGEALSPLRRLEHAIHPWVMLGVMPLFGLASAGVELGNLSLIASLPTAIALGLFVGKQLGIFGAIWLTVRSGLAPRPDHVRWSELYGASVLCGIGFTMSLFIGSLAFPASPEDVEAAKVGTIAGSLLSALLGYVVLRFLVPRPIDAKDAAYASELFAADQEKEG